MTKMRCAFIAFIAFISNFYFLNLHFSDSYMISCFRLQNKHNKTKSCRMNVTVPW